MTSSTQEHSNRPSIGTTLGGRFRIVRYIGEGGMGVVLEAENTLTGKRVAIKWMHPQMAAQADAAERMVREARASARVRHPNVVDVYDVVQEEGAIFLVMELLEGEPLSALLERGDAPPHTVIGYLIDAMRGVAAAHRGGVIHRDIKPDNIFLATEPDRSKPIPKVLDFGISKLADREGGLSLTRTGMTLGTPLYMSYEQLAGVRDIDGRTDVYAFGVILYEALTGNPPYEAQTFSELIIKITTTEPIAPKTVRPSLPGSLSALVQKAMARDRDQRTASLDALIAELEPFASFEGFQSRLTGADAQIFSSAATLQAPTPISVPVRVSMEGKNARVSSVGAAGASSAAAVAFVSDTSGSGEHAVAGTHTATGTNETTTGTRKSVQSALGTSSAMPTGEGVLSHDDEVRPSSIPKSGGRGVLLGGVALLVLAGLALWMMREEKPSASAPHVVAPEPSAPSAEPAAPSVPSPASDSPAVPSKTETPSAAAPASDTPAPAVATPAPEPKAPAKIDARASTSDKRVARKPQRAVEQPAESAIEPPPAPRPRPPAAHAPSPRAGRANADEF